jgi:hypothetical protein
VIDSKILFAIELKSVHFYQREVFFSEAISADTRVSITLAIIDLSLPMGAHHNAR